MYSQRTVYVHVPQMVYHNENMTEMGEKVIIFQTIVFQYVISLQLTDWKHERLNTPTSQQNT